MWSLFWSILVCKIPQYLEKSYQFGQLIILFQKVDTLRLLKIYVMFCPFAGAKYPIFRLQLMYYYTPIIHSNAKKTLFSGKPSDTNSSLQMRPYYKKNWISSQYLSLQDNTLQKSSLTTSLKLSLTSVTSFSTDFLGHKVPKQSSQ